MSSWENEEQKQIFRDRWREIRRIRKALDAGIAEIKCGDTGYELVFAPGCKIDDIVLPDEVRR